MEERIQNIRQQAGQVFERLSPAQRTMFGLLTVLVLASLAGLIYATTRTDFATLYSGIDDRFGGKVVEQLKAQKIPYELNGGTIRVPTDRVAELRMTLVSQGIASGVGYELIDQDDMFGTPNEIIKLNQHRMLEGELSRSISTLSGIRQARVHLAVPPRNLFVEDKDPVNASVMLELSPGMRLARGQIQSIVELVAGAVPGLDSSRVNVVDSSGRVLNRFAEDLVGGQTSLEYQTQLEMSLTRKAQEAIEAIVGPGNARVVVTSKMDFSREVRTEELYDPEKQVVRSEETLSEEREAGGGRVGGEAGAQGVVRVGDASSSARERVSTNYEINKVTRQVQGPASRLERLSIAVVFNENYAGEGKTAAPGVGDKIQNIVMSAVEFDKNRGDQISVVASPFQRVEMSAAAFLDQQNQNYWYDMLARYGLLFLIAGAIFFIAFRLMRYLTTAADAAEVLADGQLPPGEDALALPGAELLDELDEDEGPILERIREYVRKHPDKASAVIRYWLSPVQEEDRG